MKIKRLLATTILGLLFGFVCYGFATSGSYEIPVSLAISIILGRMLIGVAIGLSRFPIKHWALHGITIGFLFSLPAGFGAMLVPENPEFPHIMLLTSTIVMGMIYGFFIELITTLLLKLKQ